MLGLSRETLLTIIEDNLYKISENDYFLKTGLIKLLEINFNNVIWTFSFKGEQNENRRILTYPNERNRNRGIITHYSIFFKDEFRLQNYISFSSNFSNGLIKLAKSMINHMLELKVYMSFFYDYNSEYLHEFKHDFNKILDYLPHEIREKLEDERNYIVKKEKSEAYLLFNLLRWEGKFFDVDYKIYTYLHLFKDGDIIFSLWYAMVPEITGKLNRRSPLEVRKFESKDFQDPLFDSLKNSNSIISVILQKYNILIKNEIEPIAAYKKPDNGKGEWLQIYVVNHKIAIYWDVKSSLCGSMIFPGLKDGESLNFCYKGLTDENGENDIFNNIKKVVEAATQGSYKNFFIKAPPGSGKEMYAKLLVSAARHRYRGAFKVINASDKIEEVLQTLFGIQHQNAIVKGYMDEVKNGAIFLDEIGKSDEQLRARLLRFLQTGDYRRVGGLEPLQRGDVLMIFASTPRDKMKAAEPEDFWTRLKEIELQNPLKIGSIDKCNVLRSVLEVEFRNRNYECPNTEHFMDNILKRTFEIENETDYGSKIYIQCFNKISDYLNYLYKQFWWELMEKKISSNKLPSKTLFMELIIKKVADHVSETTDTSNEDKKEFQEELGKLFLKKLRYNIEKFCQKEIENRDKKSDTKSKSQNNPMSFDLIPYITFRDIRRIVGDLVNKKYKEYLGAKSD